MKITKLLHFLRTSFHHHNNKNLGRISRESHLQRRRYIIAHNFLFAFICAIARIFLWVEKRLDCVFKFY
jgi:hypothetical protein